MTKTQIQEKTKNGDILSAPDNIRSIFFNLLIALDEKRANNINFLWLCFASWRCWHATKIGNHIHKEAVEL